MTLKTFFLPQNTPRRGSCALWVRNSRNGFFLNFFVLFRAFRGQLGLPA